MSANLLSIKHMLTRNHIDIADCSVTVVLHCVVVTQLTNDRYGDDDNETTATLNEQSQGDKDSIS